MDDRLAPGLHPFWFWNAPLDPAAIEAQVAALAAGGCRGVFIHPRQGLAVPYLSAAFFELVACAIRACRRHGIRPHLYDEFPYPSGMAGGLVTLGHPEFAATALQHPSREHPGGAVDWTLPPGEVLACQAVPLGAAGADWSRARDLRAAVGVGYAEESWFAGGMTSYTGQRFFAHAPQPRLAAELPVGRWLLVAAVQVRVTGHKYWGEYADVCDPAAMARFRELTHEAYARQLGPELMAELGCCFVDEIHPGWSRHLLARYRERHGEDPAAALVALHHRDHPRHAELVARFDDLRYDAFVESFEQPLADWCRAQGLLYVAEKPLLRLEQLRHVDVPGCDAGHVRAGRRHDLLRADLRSNARATASAARLYAKPGALCEAFHSLGWSATLEDARLIVDHLLLHGIDRIVPHGAFASTHGLRKHDAPPSWFTQQPHWPLFRLLGERIATITAAIGPLHHDAEVLVVDPGLARGDEAGRDYEDLLHRLTASRREYLIVDPRWLREQPPRRGELRVGARAIEAVVAPVAAGDDDLETWLAHWAASGGELTRGELPGEGGLPGASVSAGDPAALHQARFVGGHHLLVNHTSEAIEVALPAGSAPLAIGDALPAVVGGHLRLPPYASAVLAPETKPAPDAKPAPELPVLAPPWPRRWCLERDRANTLRLGRWALRVEQDGVPRGAGPVDPRPIGDQLAQAGIALVYRRCQRFGLDARLELPELTLRYHHDVVVDAGVGPLHLVIEPDGLRAREWWFELGGRRIEAAAFAPVPHHVAGSLGVALELPPGEHRLELVMRVDRDDHGLLAPVYLAGEVAVHPGAVPRLAPPLAAADWGDLDGAGLAHFAGVLTWSAELELDGVPHGELELELPALAIDAFEIALGAGAWHPVAWSPRRVRLPAGALRAGRCPIQVRQYTSLGRAFDAERWDPVGHRLESVDTPESGERCAMI